MRYSGLLPSLVYPKVNAVILPLLGDIGQKLESICEPGYVANYLPRAHKMRPVLTTNFECVTNFTLEQLFSIVIPFLPRRTRSSERYEPQGFLGKDMVENDTYHKLECS